MLLGVLVMGLQFGSAKWFRPDNSIMRLIATQLRCPQVGDEAKIGDVVALGIEPGDPYGCIVEFLNDGGLGNVAVQRYQAGDSVEPTGEIRRGAVAVAFCGWTQSPRYAALDEFTQQDSAPEPPTPKEAIAEFLTDMELSEVIDDALEFSEHLLAALAS